MNVERVENCPWDLAFMMDVRELMRDTWVRGASIMRWPGRRTGEGEGPALRIEEAMNGLLRNLTNDFDDLLLTMRFDCLVLDGSLKWKGGKRDGQTRSFWSKQAVGKTEDGKLTLAWQLEDLPAVWALKNRSKGFNRIGWKSVSGSKSALAIVENSGGFRLTSVPSWCKYSRWSWVLSLVPGGTVVDTWEFSWRFRSKKEPIVSSSRSQLNLSYHSSTHPRFRHTVRNRDRSWLARSTCIPWLKKKKTTSERRKKKISSKSLFPHATTKSKTHHRRCVG